MLNNRRRMYRVYVARTAPNEYREAVPELVYYKTVRMSIADYQRSAYTVNDLRLQEVTHIGWTADRTLCKGMSVEGRYTVEHVADGYRETMVYLKELTQ